MRFPLGAVATIRGRQTIRTCGYKHKHWTRGGAAAHLRSLQIRFGENAGLTVYRCKHCGAWHVGRLAADRAQVMGGLRANLD